MGASDMVASGRGASGRGRKRSQTTGLGGGVAVASRREVLTGAGLLAATATASALLPAFVADAAPLRYELRPVQVRDDVWVVLGANEAITRNNGGAIANIGIIKTSEGAVVIDTGPSKRYGTQLVDLAKELTGKPVVRAYVTHFHPDHVFGNQAFGGGVVAAPAEVIQGLRQMGEDFSSAMYYIAGDWMRGTEVTLPDAVVKEGAEEIGKHVFTAHILAGHTGCDLAIVEETSGVLFAGDLVFLDRAPTTPHAELAAWRQSLKAIESIAGQGMKVVPGHGPVHDGLQGSQQTRQWLDMVEALIVDCFDSGMSATEAIAQPLPEWARSIALARYEYERSVLHFYSKLEAGRWPRVDVQGG